MSDKEINKLNVRISADVKHILAGRYSILPNRITINAGHFWYWYEKSVQNAEERVKTRTIPRHLMREAVRDPALRSANVSLNKSLHHESKHASEGALKLFGFALTDTSLALGTTALLGAGIEEVIDKDINPATLKGMAVMLGGMYASSLLVAPEHKGNQIGAKLLDWAEKKAHAEGKKWIRLDCWTTNSKLHAYYKEHGFSHVRTILDRKSGALFQRSTA